MGAYRGNVDKVMADAKEIARRLRTTDVTLPQLMGEYQCAYPSLMRAIRNYISSEEWRQIKRGKLLKWGAGTRFRKGHPSWNKLKTGMHLSPASEFKKGCVAINVQPTCTVRIRNDKSGRQFRFIKIADNRRPGDWIPYARYVWQQAKGPIPAGRLVVHIDGDTLNDDAGNLRLLDRAGHMRLERQRDPNMERRRILACAKAARRRKARNRKIKARMQRQADLEARRAERDRRRAHREQDDRKGFEARIAELKAGIRSWWECIGCGFEFETEPTGICPKCNGLRFERIVQRRNPPSRHVEDAA